MSHETQYPQIIELIIEPEWDQSISINSDLNYFYVPALPEWTRFEYDGLLYEGVQYNWDEVDYRLSADLAIPEPASAGVIIGCIALLAICIKQFKKGK